MTETVLVLLIKLAAKIPLWLADQLAVILGNIIYWLPIRENKISKKNLDLVFADKGIAFRNRLRKKSLIETGKALLETPRIWYSPPKEIDNLIAQICGKDLVDQAFANSKGVILVSPHIGSWELMGIWLSINYPVTSLFRKIDFPKINALVKKSRESLGANLVPNTNKGVISLIQSLRQGKVTGVLPDHDPGAAGSVFVDFFGILTRTSTLVPKLAQKTGAKVLMAYVLRLDSKHQFKLIFKKPDVKIYDENLKVSARALNQELETIILAKPEQYLWSYNRFKARPGD